ncbi:MAG: hypothetical protein GX166_06825 [Clostridiaceae bacterium]|jgi:hypothetical protein|nr:hypothetical protein [Clostridiaceae bacterium]HOA32683.1 hypothetical protein [Clostridia bacterium]
MKKLMLILLSVILVVSIAACARDNNNGDDDPKATEEPKGTEKPKTEGNLEGSLEELIEKIYENADVDYSNIELVNTEVTEETCEYFTGVADLEYEEALASEPAINPGAHSLVLIRMPEGADIDKARQEILEGADPFKWVCVGVEKVIVNNAGNLIILIMSNDADALHDSFLELAGDLAGEPISKEGKAQE